MAGQSEANRPLQKQFSPASIAGYIAGFVFWKLLGWEKWGQVLILERAGQVRGPRPSSGGKRMDRSKIREES